MVTEDGSGGGGEKSSNSDQISNIMLAIWAAAVGIFLCIISSKASI